MPLKSIKKYLNKPILSLHDGRRIGTSLEFIVEPDFGKVIGIVAEKKGFFLKKNKVVSFSDVREISAKAIIVDSVDALVRQKEVIHIDKILKSKRKIMGAKVITKPGVYVGKVFDFLTDDFFNIVKLYVYPPVFNVLESQVIIHRDYILSVKKGVIIIEDNKEKEKKRKTAEVS